METFKEIIESYGKQLSFSCKAYKQNGTLYKSITEDDVVSENLRFDGALYTCVMRCLDAVLAGDHRELVKESKFSNCSLTAKKSGMSKTINYGSFFVGEAPEYDEAENTTKFICYDSMYKTTKTYVLDGVTFPITLKEYARKVFAACGLTCANLDDLRNGSKLVTEDRYKDAANDSGSAYTYRDVLDDIAKSAGCSFACKSDINGDSVDKVYVIYVTDGNGSMKEPLCTLDISNFKSLTVGEHYGPVNSVIFSRQPQEDNVYLRSAGVTDETAVEVKLTQPLTAEGTDEERLGWLSEILKAIKGTEYRCYALESYGIGYLNFGDVFKIKAYKRTGLTFDYSSPEEYLSVFMRSDMLIDGNIKESSKLEMPVATATDYNAAVTVGEKKLLQAYMKVDKQLGLIEAAVFDENGGSRIEVNEKAIKQAVEGVNKIEKAGYITEVAAKSLIESNNDKIAMTVAGQLNIGTRNIFLDSECFKNSKVLFHNSKIATAFGNELDLVSDNSALPSGKMRQIGFTIIDGTKRAGIYFNSVNLLGQQSGEINRISAEKTYTLSFYAQCISENETETIDRANLIYAGTDISVQYISNSDLTITEEWKKYTFTFKLLSAPTNFLFRLFVQGESGQAASFGISSLKLEEGNVATDWTPNVNDIEQSVEAKLELCVKTDESGNLQSAIHAKANQISIESDNFKLSETGEITATKGYIGGWEITDEGFKSSRKKTFPPMTAEDINLIDKIIENEVECTQDYLDKYDFNEDGLIDLTDSFIAGALFYNYDATKDVITTIEISPNVSGNFITLSVESFGERTQSMIGPSEIKFPIAEFDILRSESIFFLEGKGVTPVTEKSYAWLAVDVATGRIITVGG